jgi:hypothetical protein
VLAADQLTRPGRHVDTLPRLSEREDKSLQVEMVSWGALSLDLLGFST